MTAHNLPVFPRAGPLYLSRESGKAASAGTALSRAHDLRHVGKMHSDKSLNVSAYSMAGGSRSLSHPATLPAVDYEQMGDAIAFVFVIVTRLAPASFARNVSMTLKHQVS
jgi:hypothetical protein